MTEAAEGERFSPELRLALALLSADPARRSPDSLRAITVPAFDWPGFADLVIDRHGVGPLIWHRLRDLATIEPPQPARARLEEHHRANIELYLVQKQQIIRVQRALSAAGADPMLVKGISTADRFYEQGRLRAVGDIDLQVKPSGIERADAALGAAGYRCLKPPEPLRGLQRRFYRILIWHFLYADEHSGQFVELHWRLARRRSLLHPTFWTALDGTERLVLSGSHGIAVLAPLAHFVHSTVHGAEHAWARLKWLVDLCPMIASLSDHDCVRLLEFGRATGVLPALLLGVNLARVLLDADCRPALLEALEANDRVRRLTASSIRALLQDQPPWFDWAGDPFRYLDQFRHELGISNSMVYRASTISLFPFYYYFLTRPWTWFGRRPG